MTAIVMTLVRAVAVTTMTPFGSLQSQSMRKAMRREFSVDRGRASRLHFLIAIAASFAFSFSWPAWARDTADTAEKAKFKIWDSKSLVTVETGDAIFWVNDDEVIFVGYERFADPSVPHT